MATQYRKFPLSAFGSTVNLLTDTIVATLHTTTYNPASTLDTDQFVSNLSGELTTSGGYTVGGATLTSKTLAYIPAASWGLTWAATTAYTAGAMLVASSFVYRATVAGTSGSSAPAWPTTIGSTVTDGGVTWMCEGTGNLAWTASTTIPTGWVVRAASNNGFLYRAAVGGSTNTSAPTWPTTIGQTVTDSGVTWECVGSGVICFHAANPSWASATFTGVRYIVFSDRTPSGAGAQPLVAFNDYGVAQAGGGGSFTGQINAQGLALWFMP